MRIRCPHCQSQLELNAAAPAADIECSSCHRKFVRSGDETLIADPPEAAETVSAAPIDESPAPAVQPRKRLGNYELVREIARGGMGVVYLARHAKLRRHVALKMIRAGELADEAALARFQTEARAAAQLDHPGIVPVFEVGEHGGQHFIALAYIDGQSLKDKVAARPLPPTDAARIMKSVAEAVHFAHERGVIHRDLKPHNILLDKSGVPRVTDFGLAKDVRDDAEMTATGQVLGTPAYMAPEQAAGNKGGVDCRSDVYSLGATLYCLLTGRPPFQAASHLETIRQVVEQDPVSLRLINPAVPRDLESICLKCLRKEPQSRYGTARELADDLLRCLEHRPVQARPMSGMERAQRWVRRRPTAAALIVVLIAGLGGSLFLLGKWLDTERFAQSETSRANEATEAIEEAETRVTESQQDVRASYATVASRQLADGLDACERGEIDLGVHRLIRALETAPVEEAELRNTIRRNIRLWSASLLQLVEQHASSQFGGMELLNARGTHGVRVRNAVGGNSERIVVLDRVDPRTGEVQPGSSVRIDPEWLGAGESGLSRVVAVWLSDDGLSAVLADLGAEGTQASDGSGDRGRGRGARLWSWNLSTGTGTPLPTSGATSWNGASMSDDGTWLGTVETSIEPRAFAARTWEVRVYELATGNVAFEQSAYRQIPTPPVFSHSGERFLVHGRDRSEAELRQTSDGAQIGQSLVFDGTLSSATFSADDALLMTADGTERVRLWSGLDGAPLRHTFLDAKTRRPVNCPLEGKNFHRIQRVSLSPEGRTLAAMSLLDESIRFWDIDRGTQIGQTLQRQPTTCVFLNDGRDVRLLGNPVQTWRLPGGEPAVAAPWSSEGIEPDPAALRLWAEVITGRELTNTDTLSSLSVEEWNVRRDRQRGADAVATTTIPSASPQSAAAGRAFTGTVWPRNLPVRMRADFLTIVTVAVASLSTQFSHDGTRMLNVNMLEAQLFEVATGQPVGEPIRKNQLDQFHCAAFSADSSRLLVGSGTDLKSGVVQIWDARSGTLAGGPLEHDGAVGAVAFSPQGDLFACGWGSALPDQAIGGFRGRLQLWDAATLAPIGPPQDVDGRVTEMHFTPDGRRLFTASCLGTNARLWDVETMQPIGEPMRHEAGVMASAMSPDGSVIATGSYDHVVRLWSTETGAAAAEPLAHSGIVCELAFSPDGRRFASGSYDGLLQMWDAATWQAIAEPLKLAAPLVHVEYSPDSGVLAIIDSSLKPRFFDAADGSEFASPLDAASVGGFVGFLEGRAPVVWNGQSIQVLGAIELRSSKQP